MAAHSPLTFALDQVMNMLPFTAPVWLAGLYFYVWSPRGKRFRALGVVYIAVFVLLAFDSTSRSGYLTASYSFLLAAGGAQVEDALTGSWQRLRVPVFALIAITGALAAPFAMPMLPVDSYIRYAAALGQAPSTEERKEVGVLSQFYADRHGWDDIVRGIAGAYSSLSPEERRVAGILTSNYGEAGAVDVLGPAYGLPRATSSHNNYWYWGPGPSSGEVMVVFAGTRERLQNRFENVQQAGTVDCGLCMPYENHRPVFICRHPKRPWALQWRELKHFN
jgi:hypothetical protein